MRISAMRREFASNFIFLNHGGSSYHFISMSILGLWPRVVLDLVNEFGPEDSREIGVWVYVILWRELNF